MSGLLGVAATSEAQTAYVSASLTGDVVRTTHSEGDNFGGTGSGEAAGFALRVGTALGSNWGVDLEYARPSTINSRNEFALPLLELPAIFPPVLPIPIPIPLATEFRDRHSAVSAGLWVNQSVSGRVALVYLGGVAFNRFEREYRYDFGLLAASRTIRYSAHPVVGFESWIGLTDRLTLMPGIRMRTVPGGWSIRPAVGIGWSF